MNTEAPLLFGSKNVWRTQDLKFQKPHDYIARVNMCLFNGMNVFLLGVTQTLALSLVRDFYNLGKT